VIVLLSAEQSPCDTIAIETVHDYLSRLQGDMVQTTSVVLDIERPGFTLVANVRDRGYDMCGDL
jgi:hypothetical protein